MCSHQNYVISSFLGNLFYPRDFRYVTVAYSAFLWSSAGVLTCSGQLFWVTLSSFALSTHTLVMHCFSGVIFTDDCNTAFAIVLIHKIKRFPEANS
ncbi:hypothetical protein SORBI_3005G173100 [Sorghum bicolor]|uniref:Uncharacterized protein n=1 Tax=Sorghum bicolor TaxID=4558 RepID=A0A1B6PT36_SORBI|nr:hypothetical protein SORBI_3005G173100 [Sorghum bicolor]